MYDSQSWKARSGCNTGPRDHIFQQTEQAAGCLPHLPGILGGSHLPVVSQPEISSPEETHGTPGTVPSWHTQETESPRLESAWMQGPPGTVRLPTTQLPEQFGPGRSQNPQPIWVCALAKTREPEQLRPGKYMKHKVHLGQCHCRAPWSLSSVDPGNSCCLGLWQAQCGPSTVSTLHTCQRNLFVVTISLHSTTEQVSLNE